MKFTLMLFLMYLVTELDAQNSSLEFVNASTLTIINKSVCSTSSPYSRLDSIKYKNVTAQIKRYMNYSTGLAIAFRTNSNNIYAHWKTGTVNKAVNMSMILQNGLDLYIKENGCWTFAGVGKPTLDTEHYSPLVNSMADGIKECLLYLPMFNSVDELEIGIDTGAIIEVMENPFRNKIGVMGSSIIHGASASRPGMAFPARLERLLEVECCNLGFNGQCKLDEFYSQIVVDSKIDALIVDAFSNPSAKQIRERLRPFVDNIRKIYPNMPIIFLQTVVRETAHFNEEIAAHESRKYIVARQEFNRMVEDGYENIYFIDPGMFIGDKHEGTIDGVHPNDLGFNSMLEYLYPRLRTILMKYNLIV